MNLHEETKCWWLTEDTDRHVVYVTVAQLIIILDMVLYTRKTNEYNCERQTRKYHIWNQYWRMNWIRWKTKKDLFCGGDRQH